MASTACREQWKIIRSLTFDKKDNIAVMTTGNCQLRVCVRTIMCVLSSQGMARVCVISILLC